MKGRKNKWLRRFKKFHKWPGIIFAAFFIFWALSGIIMNHRETFSFAGVDRSMLPGEYHYNNWNLAAVKAAEKIGTDSNLVFGNIGVWLTDDSFGTFTDFNPGFPEGIDNRKISRVFNTTSGQIYAGTLFGLYRFEEKKSRWIKLDLPVKEKRITDICQKGDSVLVMTRSHLLWSNDDNRPEFTEITLPAPFGYDNKVGLFKTLWVIHSGEIYGLPGKLIIDFVGFVFIFLTITGLVYFFMPGVFKRRARKGKATVKLARINRWSIKWHNRLGVWLVLILIINTFAGMFLRPPLLISIANARVDKIKYSHLDNPNPWFDNLRALLYDEELKRWILGTKDGLYYSDDDFDEELKPFPNQPPLSVMGINVFEKLAKGEYLVGTFNGLFRWIPESGYIENYITKSTEVQINPSGPPIGAHVVTGYLSDGSGNEYYVDYNRGVIPLQASGPFSAMPEEIRNLPMSLWNVMLEVHTARFFKFMFGNFYILFIPLFGLFSLIILITGLVVWLKLYFKKRK